MADTLKLLLTLYLLVATHSFTVPRATNRRLHFAISAIDSSNIGNVQDTTQDCTRRNLIWTAAASTALLLPSNAVHASTTTTPPQKAAQAANYDCLLDLPPLPANHKRVFFCRHGQTENNRLGRIQGARIDADINDTGVRQATRLGTALNRALSDTDVAVVHSPLLRAKRTAELAVSQIATVGPKSLSSMSLEPLELLKEVDFGSSLDGQPVEYYRSRLTQTYATWATGNLDATMGQNGESGRQVLDRIEDLLTNLEGRPQSYLIAVTHSSYLRMLCAYTAQTSLVTAMTWKFGNASVSVVDLADKSKSRRLLRTNEQRHLGELAT